MTDETTTTNTGSAPATAAVPAHIIPTSLPHPNTSGPLERGLTYLHHFEVELISDGRRLWDAASAEGKQLIADIKGEKAASADAAAAAKSAPPMAATPPNTGLSTEGASAQAGSQAADTASKPAT